MNLIKNIYRSKRNILDLIERNLFYTGFFNMQFLAQLSILSNYKTVKNFAFPKIKYFDCLNFYLIKLFTIINYI